MVYLVWGWWKQCKQGQGWWTWWWGGSWGLCRCGCWESRRWRWRWYQCSATASWTPRYWPGLGKDKYGILEDTVVTFSQTYFAGIFAQLIVFTPTKIKPVKSNNLNSYYQS